MRLASNFLRCGVLAIAGDYGSFGRSAGPESSGSVQVRVLIAVCREVSVLGAVYIVLWSLALS